MTKSNRFVQSTNFFRKSQDWYKQAFANMKKQNIDPRKIARYGEEDGIRALLSFSTLCLIAAEDSEGKEKDEFVKLSMSILLPMVRICTMRLVIHTHCLVSTILGSISDAQLYLHLDTFCH